MTYFQFSDVVRNFFMGLSLVVMVASAFPRIDAAFVGTASRQSSKSSFTHHHSFANDYLSTLQEKPAIPDPLQPSSAFGGSAGAVTLVESSHNNPGSTAAVSDTFTRTESSSGVLYQQVAEGLDLLYPPKELASRNAKSRSDGYWPFISGGQDEPPKEFTYGEFDALFFAELLDQALQYMPGSPTSYENKIVCDIGSGAGRLVIGAAALHPGLEKSRGVEILEGIHEMAVENVAKCQQQQASTTETHHHVLPPYNLPMAPMELTCGSISDPAIDISQVDIFFIASTCMPEHVLVDIAHAIGRQCRVGTLVISTDYELITERTVCCETTGKHFQLEKVNQVDGYCWVVGGLSTAFTYRLVESGAA